VSNRRKTVLVIFWIEGVIFLAFLIFNIRMFVSPQFPDDISNKITIVALLGMDVFLVPIGFWVLVKTIKILMLVR
jgi:hypothetical protein